ncbi:MAG TPA: hypothetical protein VIB00_12630 [Pyrinomonadaceae bacterium]|jgi:hypothetical protein
MKAVTTKEIVSLAGIAIVTPVFALSILVSARASALNESDLTLLGMALCGAVISGITGFGRRTVKAEPRTCRPSRNQQSIIGHS